MGKPGTSVTLLLYFSPSELYLDATRRLIKGRSQNLHALQFVS